MKDQEFLQRAADDRAALIGELESRRKLSRLGCWLCFAVLAGQIIFAMIRDTRVVDFGPVLMGVMIALFATSQMYHDALLKALHLRTRN